jgi:hypothetical protein
MIQDDRQQRLSREARMIQLLIANDPDLHAPAMKCDDVPSSFARVPDHSDILKSGAEICMTEK